MFGKLVQLLGKPGEKGFKVIYGIGKDGYEFDFAKVTFGNSDPDVTKTYIYGGYRINEKKDNFKEIVVFNGELEEKDCEEYLLVIIPYTNQLRTDAELIAGRYYNEAILKVCAGQIIKVSKGSEEETYMAVQAGNEMCLIKKNR